MDPGSILTRLAAVLILVAINAFFVAAEFSLVAVRRSRIEQRLRAGDARAVRIMRALDRPDEFISAAQLGITVASIGIGYIAESALHELLAPLLDRLPLGSLPFVHDASAAAHVLGTFLTLLLVTYLHVVLGEQVPKMISIQRAEPVAFLTVAPTQWFGVLFRPLIRFMSSSANAVIALFGLRPTAAHSIAHSREELGILVEESQQGGQIEVGEEEMIHGVIELGELIAREVMTPRRDFKALPDTATREETLEFVISEAHSRVPVYHDTLDEIVGILLAKDLLAFLASDGERPFDLRSIAREPYFVPDTKPVTDLLAELRSRTVHMAIVLDEFGGTEGLVTLEDLLEEIVGDIYDEHDVPEDEETFRELSTGDVLMDGGLNIDEVNERLGLALANSDFDTIGGYVFGELGRVPVKGDIVQLRGGSRLLVEATRQRRVTLVRYVPGAESAEDTDAGEEGSDE